MNKTITTIIPFFNSGDSIRLMVNSLLEQTVLPTEILLIDDGSTDKSSDIAKDYSAQYSFIKYLRQNHAGVSTARNLGIESATSAWISFLDADDYIEKNMYEYMTNAITDENIGGCLCGYYTEVNGISTAYANDTQSSLTSSDLVKAMYTNDNVAGFLFNKLYNANLVRQQRFDVDIKMTEDLLFQTKLLCANKAFKFNVINAPLYHYVQNTSSATNNINMFENNEFKYKPAFNIIRQLLREQFVEDKYNSILEYSMYRLLKSYHNGDKNLKVQIRLLQKELKTVHPSSAPKRRIAYLHFPLLFSHFLN